MSKKKTAAALVVCTPVSLPEPLMQRAATMAVEINPANAPHPFGDGIVSAGHLAVLTNKYWGAGGVDLTVGFMEECAPDLRDRILSHMNAWQQWANVRFRWTQQTPEVRISRGPGGYWSYLGTDVLSIPANQPTMNLEGFTMRTAESEYVRVVRHETGHTLGFPHEHMRADLVALLDPVKTVAYFRKTQGWDERTTKEQVLTPISERAIMGTPRADPDSIMTYQLPGTITRTGAPIPGGRDISDLDKEFAAKLYPKPTAPPSGTRDLTIKIKVDATNTVIGGSVEQT